MKLSFLSIFLGSGGVENAGKGCRRLTFIKDVGGFIGGSLQQTKDLTDVGIIFQTIYLWKWSMILDSMRSTTRYLPLRDILLPSKRGL